MDTGPILYTAAFGLILIGSAGIVLSTHLVRIIFGIALLEAGANLLLLLATFREGTRAPIIVDGNITTTMADPVPQALVLTAIVIGVDRTGGLPATDARPLCQELQRHPDGRRTDQRPGHTGPGRQPAGLV